MPDIPPHGHCEICSSVVKVGQRFCSKQCVERNEELVAEKKKAMWKFAAFIIALAVLFMVLRLGWI